MNRITTVVIDDDPTGIQTVHGCLVLTGWDVKTLRYAFKDTLPFLFILSNTRALNSYDAAETIGEIMHNIKEAKGGITSHVILVEGLKIDKARVMGQILPGIPVIRLPVNHRFGPIPFVVFPGNVGEEDSLFKVYSKFLNAI